MKNKIFKLSLGKVIEYLIILAIMLIVLYFLDGKHLRLSSMRYVIYVFIIGIGIDVFNFFRKKDKQQKEISEENQTTDTK